MAAFLAHFLVLLAAWTLTIKFALPLAFAAAEGVPAGTYVMWDFWWVVHLWLARALLRPQRYTVALAAGVSVAEIAIVSVKFALFLDAPDWTIWTANWFVNKLFVLACFLVMLAWLAVRRERLRLRPAAPVS